MSSLMEMMYTYTLRVNGNVLFSVSDPPTGLIVGIVVLAVIVVILAAVVFKHHIPLKPNKDSEKRKPLNDSVSQSEQLQPPQTSPVI